MKMVRRTVESGLLGGLSRSMETAPWSTCRLAGSWFGLAFFHGSKRRREIAISNLRRAFPKLSEAAARRLARRSAQNFGMSFCEFLHLRTASPSEIRAYCDWQGLEHIEGALTEGHGVMLPTAHFGAWEVMGARGAQEFPLTVMVRLTSNQTLRNHIMEVRKAIGLEMILKADSARASLSVLHGNGALAIFPDQHAGAEGTLLPMFGHPTRIFTSPARLALTAKSPIVPTYGVRRTPWLADGRVIIKASPGLSLHKNKKASRDETVLEGTRFIVRHIEEIVTRYPDQWLWMHKRWRPEDELSAPEDITPYAN